MSTNNYWPFAQPTSDAIPRTIDYDLVIQEPYPGVVLNATAEGGAYAEMRSVDGCVWIVTNAMWNPNTLQWEQDAPADPALPAYALRQCEATGTFSRLVAPATGAINTAVAWTAVHTEDMLGDVTIAPSPLTSEDNVPLTLDPVWNAGLAALMVAFAVDVTDTSSATGSLLESLSVGGVPKWQVRKDGVLVTGQIPASAIIGGIVAGLVAGTGITITDDGDNIYTIGLSHGDYVDLANAQQVTGLKTLEGVQINTGAATPANGVWADASGNQYLASGAVPVTIDSQIWQAAATSAVIFAHAHVVDGTVEPGMDMYYNTGLTIGNTYVPTLVASIDYQGNATFRNLTLTGDAKIDGDLEVDGTSDFKGAATFEDGINVSGGTVTIPPSAFTNVLVGKNGVSVYPDGDGTHVDVDGAGLLASITSSNDSLIVDQTGQTVDVIVNSVGPAGNQRGTGSVAISTSGGGSPTTVTIPTPYGSASDYVAFVQLQAQGGVYQATVSTYVLQVDGASFQVYAEGDATTPQTVNFNWVTILVT